MRGPLAPWTPFAGVDPSTIKARTTDGVVEVTIPLPSQKTKEPVTVTPTAA